MSLSDKIPDIGAQLIRVKDVKESVRRLKGKFCANGITCLDHKCPNCLIIDEEFGKELV